MADNPGSSGERIFETELSSVYSALARNHGKQVRSESLKQRVVRLAEGYFSGFRNHFSYAEEKYVQNLDGQFHELLELTHKASAKKSYLARLKSIQAEAQRLKIIHLKNKPQAVLLSEDEKKIIGSLRDDLPTACASYEQACIDLKLANRISYRGTAADLRETLRELLDFLAPDSSVMSSEGFTLEKDRTKPTMKQQAKFILKSRGLRETSYKTSLTNLDVIEELIGQLARSIYDRTSLSTHTKTSLEEVKKVKRYLDVILMELLALS